MFLSFSGYFPALPCTNPLDRDPRSLYLHSTSPQASHHAAQSLIPFSVTTLLFTLTTALPSPDTAAVSSASAVADYNRSTPTSLPFGTAPISFFSLPTDFPPPAREDAANIEAIRNTLALYPFCIDGKNFAALSNVFTTNAVANYSAPLNVLMPLSTIESVPSSSLACVTTQHNFGTQLINIISPYVAESITYYRAAHFGTGALAGQVAYAYGRYQDTWQRQDDGAWRIVYRNLVYMVSLEARQKRLDADILIGPNYRQ